MTRQTTTSKTSAAHRWEDESLRYPLRRRQHSRRSRSQWDDVSDGSGDDDEEDVRDDMIRLEGPRSKAVRPKAVSSKDPRGTPRRVKNSRLAHLGTHHILREWAVRVIQTRCGSYMARRREEKAVAASALRSLAFDVMDTLLDEYIRIEFIPDILIDVLTTGNDDDAYKPKPVREQAICGAYASMLNDVVVAMLTEIVHATVQSLVSAYFKQETRVVNPWTMVVDHFVDEWIHGLLHEIVVDGIRDLVEAYLANKKHQAVLDEFLHGMVVDVAFMSMREMTHDRRWTSLLHETLTSMLPEVAHDEIHQAQTLHMDLVRDNDRRLIAEASGPLLEHAILRGLLQLIAQKADRMAFKEACDHMLSMELLKRLLARQAAAAQREAVVVQSPVLTACHNRVMHDALFVLLSTTLQDKLDTFEDEIDRIEQES
ncbi:Aste57867_1652 [Aphanomyces stellatus]|uniref:Aste57867_1652 protein n=1 Tax=Aphanomyces stellatus TaxID=120398 RepID=A0A485K8D0_9STRA|nr:hypothetical protein As57867_001650 [Aphanomyces stellatus]VFT78865.1 Aste57867_1652 [Aphanomyces stellatus]